MRHPNTPRDQAVHNQLEARRYEPARKPRRRLTRAVGKLMRDGFRTQPQPDATKELLRGWAPYRLGERGAIVSPVLGLLGLFALFALAIAAVGVMGAAFGDMMAANGWQLFSW